MTNGIGGTDDVLAHPTDDNLLERRKAMIGRMVEHSGTRMTTQDYVITQMAYGVIEIAEQMKQQNALIMEMLVHWKPR